MTTQYNFIRDINGYNGYALIPSDQIWSVKLTASTATPLVVPSDATQYVIYVSTDAPNAVWISTNGVATIPTSNDFSKENSFIVNSILNPIPAFAVNGGITLSFISSSATLLSVMFFKVR